VIPRLAQRPSRFLRGTILVGGWESGAVSEKKPEIYFPVARKFCPVCGKVSYSLSGEHPQCALTRSDTALKAKLKKRDDRRRAALANK
jgi:hypothetical protein